jgi:hypothetical protein
VIHARQDSPRYTDAAQAHGGGERAAVYAGMKLAMRVLWISIKKAGWSYVRCRTERLTGGNDNRGKQGRVLAWQAAPNTFATTELKPAPGRFLAGFILNYS